MMKIKISSKTPCSKTPSSKTPSSKTPSRKSNSLKHTDIRRRVTRKHIRQHEIERVDKIVTLIPKFIKFYNKFTKDDLLALKYYKGQGSFFQTILLTNEKKPREIHFPFPIFQEESFRRDVYSYGNTIYPMLKSFDIKDTPTYIENNYRARLNILNNLDKIYNKVDCPKLSGDEILFRGMELPASWKKYKEGDTFTFKNFISTTADRNIAERFSSHDSMFILQGIKDIPFLYMPQNKFMDTTPLEYTKEMNKLLPYHDLSEYTLPRHLEFKIDKIEDGFISPQQARGWSNKSNKNRLNFQKLDKLLSKKGIITEPSLGKAKKNKDPKETKDTENNREAIIEKALFPHLKLFYCTFTQWHPREPLVYEDIMKGAKYILDTGALNTWNNKYVDF